MTAEDPFHLDRFVAAQDSGGGYASAVTELRRGRKTGHWIWFVFPQIRGLGQSPTSVFYSISSLAEAQAYLRHPVLGPRLLDCAGLVARAASGSAEQILGGLDAMKLRSSMTLFHRAAPGEPVFAQVLARHFAGSADPATEELLGPADPINRPAGPGTF